MREKKSSNGEWVENIVEKVFVIKQSSASEQPTASYESYAATQQPSSEVKFKEFNTNKRSKIKFSIHHVSENSCHFPF